MMNESFNQRLIDTVNGMIEIANTMFTQEPFCEDSAVWSMNTARDVSDLAIQLLGRELRHLDPDLTAIQCRARRAVLNHAIEHVEQQVKDLERAYEDTLAKHGVRVDR